MSFSVGKDSQSASRPILVPFLLFIFVAWQAVYQFYSHHTANHEDSDLGSDGACSVLPGASGYSTLCKEAHLFKGWDEMPSDSSAELESLLEVSPNKAKQEDASSASDTSKRGLRGDSKQAASEKSQKQSGFMAKASEPAPKKMFSAKGLSELQKEVDAKMQLQARRHAEHRAMRALSVAARGESVEEPTTTRALTPWAQGLLHEMHDLEEHMNHWREERSDHAAAFAAAFSEFAAQKHAEHAKEEAKEDLMTPWAHNLDDLTHDIEHHLEQREKERAEHVAARKAAHDSRIAAAHANALKESSTDMTSPLLQEIETLGAQLCHDPKRRNSPGCAHFTHSESKVAADRHAAHNHSQIEADAHARLLEKHMEQLHKDQEHDDEEIRRQSDTFLRELCADPARKSYPTCAHLTETTTVAPMRSGNLRAGAKSTSKAEAPPRPKKLEEHPTVLQWTPLADSEVNVNHHHVGEAVVTMDRTQLRGHHWEGKIPKVACITVLPEGKVTENLMKYFMDNYYLQNYEGPRELVLVYHNTDAEAARIAHIYADGTSVKAAAARGIEAYPSATAYRYGAWIAKDADIVARWDFEGFHHPNRLSMHVHAIALSKRPVSLLSGVTAFDTDGKHAVVSNTGTYHGSMVGDAAWMRKNWMPMLEEENAVLHGLHSGEVAQVAMPELLTYHDASMFRK